MEVNFEKIRNNAYYKNFILDFKRKDPTGYKSRELINEFENNSGAITNFLTGNVLNPGNRSKQLYNVASTYLNDLGVFESKSSRGRSPKSISPIKKSPIKSKSPRGRSPIKSKSPRGRSPKSISPIKKSTVKSKYPRGRSPIKKSTLKSKSPRGRSFLNDIKNKEKWKVELNSVYYFQKNKNAYKITRKSKSPSREVDIKSKSPPRKVEPKSKSPSNQRLNKTYETFQNEGTYGTKFITRKSQENDTPTPIVVSGDTNIEKEDIIDDGEEIDFNALNDIDIGFDNN